MHRPKREGANRLKAPLDPDVLKTPFELPAEISVGRAGGIRYLPGARKNYFS